MQQVITGDATDGYPGCPGVGPKSKFVAALHEETTALGMWAHVISAYETKGLTAKDAVLQARMARILRAEDWDFQKKAPRLWCPPVN
jgi:DNA polymerase-1